jgi:hypothetical protein
MADCRACGGRGVASSDGWPDVADSSKLAVWEPWDAAGACSSTVARPARLGASLLGAAVFRYERHGLRPSGETRLIL